MSKKNKVKQDLLEFVRQPSGVFPNSFLDAELRFETQLFPGPADVQGFTTLQQLAGPKIDLDRKC